MDLKSLNIIFFIDLKSIWIMDFLWIMDFFMEWLWI